jgi:hypothetical protein
MIIGVYSIYLYSDHFSYLNSKVSLYFIRLLQKFTACLIYTFFLPFFKFY